MSRGQACNLAESSVLLSAVGGVLVIAVNALSLGAFEKRVLFQVISTPCSKVVNFINFEMEIHVNFKLPSLIYSKRNVSLLLLLVGVEVEKLLNS